MLGFLGIGKLGLKDRINLYERLMSYTEEGYPIYDTLTKFKARYEIKNKKDKRARIIGVWLERLQRGQGFSQAIKGDVPESELNLIAAGEAGGGLYIGFKEAVRFSTSAQKIKSAIIGGAAYPAFLLLFMAGFVASFSKTMAPTFLSFLPVEQWPGDGQVLYYLSDFLYTKWWLVFMVIGALAFVINKTIGTWVGSVRKVFDHVPPWAVYKTYNASVFLIGLASMMKAGISLNDSLLNLKKGSSKWMVEYLDKMLSNLKKGGKNYGNNLNVGLMDDETAGDVIDYSELGQFEKAIQIMGERGIEGAIAKINLKMNIARNAMLMMLAVCLGWIYFTTNNLNSTIAEKASSPGGIQQQQVIPKN